MYSDALGKCCGTSDRGRTLSIYGCGLSCAVLVLVSIVAVVMVTTGSGPEQCVSLSPIKASCHGHAEVTDQMPTTAAPYLAAADEVNAIVAQASGERVLVGLSGGGALALYAGQATLPGSSSALYGRQMLLAPYVGLQTFEAILGPALSLGLGSISMDYGIACSSERRALGKAGYCNPEIRYIWAMRQVARDTLAALKTPPGTSIQARHALGRPRHDGACWAVLSALPTPPGSTAAAVACSHRHAC